MNNTWTKEDYTEYKRQLELLEKAWGYCIPITNLERMAANIINAQKGL